MSRSEVDALRKDECLQLMEQLDEALPRRGVLVILLKAMIKNFLFWTEAEEEKSPLEFAKMYRNQLADQEMRWMDEHMQYSTAGPAWDHFIKQLGLVLAEMEAHSGAKICSTMEELAEKGSVNTARRHRMPLC